MDNQLGQLAAGLDRLDRLLRGNGTPGLISRQATSEALVRAHAAQLSALATVPRDLADLKEQIEDAARKSEELAALVEEVLKEAREEALMKQGERRAVDKAGKWLKFTAVALGLVGIGGAAGIATIVQRLGDLARALP